MPFMSEEEAIAIIEDRMDDIVAKMASGSTANESRADNTNAISPSSNQPCNGTCDTDLCCNCCVC